MNRRSFIKNAIAGSSGMLVGPALLKAGRWLAADAQTGAGPSAPLEQGFLQPPPAARPHTYWMWMNGHITKQGITLDLEAMRRSGVGGTIIFNDAVGIPRGPIDFASDAWFDLVAHAAREAERLGLELSMHNAPGYSGCGGPWITPELSMQELVWSESLVTTAGPIDLQLPPPYAKRGYYRDAFVLAFPALPVETALMRDRVARVLLNGTEVNRERLLDRDPDTKVRLDHADASLVFEFAAPFEARAVTIWRTAEEPRNPYDGPKDYPPTLQLDASDDGREFRPVCRIPMPPLRKMDAPGAQSFPAVTARYFRLTSLMPTWVSEVELHAGPRLPEWPAKTNYAGARGEIPPPAGAIASDFLIDPQRVMDVTSHLDGNGRLTWDAPPGRWNILRLGHTTTGEEVAAAPDSGIGLECDKSSKAAVDFHFQAFLDPLLARLSPWVGKSFTGFMIDSWEAGKQNWTRNFPEEFRQRRQYDLRPYLPAMTGRIVGSVEKTEKFLWDVRRTQADLLAENFYGHFRELCHQRGLTLSGEPYGDGTFDSLQIGDKLDVPMSEFWAHRASDTRSTMAAAIGHAWGKQIVAAEAYTGAPETTRWTETPFGLKPDGDWIFTTGVNRLVFHTTVHQPYTTGLPGMTMGPFGTHFDRNSTWSRLAHGWTSYLSRTQYVLQQGLPVADICYFEGENLRSDAPDARSDGRSLFPGYAVDRVDAEFILKRITIADGRIALPEGMSYRLLVLPQLADISSALLRRLGELVADGMTLLVQNRVAASSGLSGGRDGDADVRRLVDELWGDLDGRAVTARMHGRGRVLWVTPSVEALGLLQLKPDFEFAVPSQNPGIRCVHRRIDDAEVYFVANRAIRDEELVCTFRVEGKQPEIWDPETGTISDAAIYEIAGGRTRVPLHLGPAGSVFVVFRRPPQTAPYLSILRDGAKLIGAPDYLAQPQSLAPLQLQFTSDGKTEALVWQDGDYRLQSARGTQSVVVKNQCRTLVVAGPWTVQFPAGLGAPAAIQLNELASLAKHPEFGVRHFSGTMTYEKTISLDQALTEGRRVFLDLGRVEIMAEVSVNDDDLGLLWKAPFRVDVTPALRDGENKLRIRVTNLWPNRLIGDEYFPPEDDYTALNAIVKLPDWFVNDRPRPGSRIAFSTWRHYRKDDPLPESGLLGPVTILTAARRIIG